MPRLDGTGPMGRGPRTGRGLGPCARGRGARGGWGLCPGGFISPKNNLATLEDEEKILEEELATIREEKKALLEEQGK